MNWLNNGSKTLVACVCALAVGAMACFKVIGGNEALAVVSTIWAGYTGANLYQNGKTTTN